MMAYKSTNRLFRDLTDDEEESFREWARENDPENMARWEIYHPVCREVWLARGIHPERYQQSLDEVRAREMNNG